MDGELNGAELTNIALTIGIDRYGHGSDLAGAVNDAKDWMAALSQRGFEVHTMLDGAASGDGIRQAMQDVVERLKRGQTGVITYSGHGTWVPDLDGDEPDKRDEAICPVDLFDHGVITDDELFDIFTRRAYGSRLIFVADSCHSGTVNRFAGPLVDPDAGERPGRRVRFLAPATFLTGDRLDRARQIGQPRVTGSRTSALTVTGCRDDEYSYDAWWPDGNGGWRANGAFTYVALRALAGLPDGARYRDWHAAIRRLLPSSDYPQTPQLAGTYDQKRWAVL